MAKFEYEITMHSAESFETLVYFCNENGECVLEDIKPDQIRELNDNLNRRGAQGWELVQVSFGKDGLMAIWKRAL